MAYKEYSLDAARTDMTASLALISRRGVQYDQSQLARRGFPSVLGSSICFGMRNCVSGDNEMGILRMFIGRLIETLSMFNKGCVFIIANEPTFPLRALRNDLVT